MNGRKIPYVLMQLQLKSLRVIKICHFNSPIFFFPPHCGSCSQGGADPFLKNFDKLQAPFRNVKGSQRDLVILNVNTKPVRTIQYNLILYGTPFK